MDNMFYKTKSQFDDYTQHKERMEKPIIGYSKEYAIMIPGITFIWYARVRKLGYIIHHRYKAYR